MQGWFGSTRRGEVMLDDVLVGVLIGAIAAGGIAGALHERGLADCERDLPRTQKCEKVWVPKKPTALAVPSTEKEAA